MNYRRGSILLYVLVVFVFFISWFDLRLRIHVHDIQRKKFKEMIEQRLDIEAQIVTYYRSNLSDTFDFVLNSTTVVSYKVDHSVYVITSGDIRMRFKYDIMEDGSFIHSHWED